MTDREGLIEAMKCIQDLYNVVRKLAERVDVLEQLMLLTPNPREEALFNHVADRYLRAIKAKELRLTDEQLKELEAEIESKNQEGS